MKKTIVTTCLLLSCTWMLSAQTPSPVNKLAGFIKVWGFIKYYHPVIASGQYDWDSVFIVSCKELMATGTSPSFQQVAERLLTIAGPDTAAFSLPAAAHPICYRNYDLSWISKNRLLSPRQKKALKYMATHPYSGLNYYAQPNRQNDGTVHTPNEKPYAEMKLPDVYYRLLAWGRFWNVVNYFYPYKYRIGQSWDKVLQQMIPVMITASDTLSWHKALAGMAASLRDNHAGLWPQVYNTLAGPYRMPFNFRLAAGKAVITGIPDSLVRQAAGLVTGSVIETMDEVRIDRKIESYQPYTEGSNAGATLRDMHALVLNSHNRQAVLAGYRPDGKKFTLTVALVERNFIKEYSDFMGMKSSTTAYLTTDSIGYVFFGNFNQHNIDSIMRSVMPARAIIFDMRNYPRDGYATYDVPGYLLSQPVIYARNTSPDFRWPGMMKYVPSNQHTPVATVGRHNPSPYKGQVILLVDERTQSAAEWACMTLQTAPRVTVIGHQTAGADGNVTRTVLPGGYSLFFSGLGIYYPDDRETQRTGIPVDIPVRYTVEDYMYQRDPVLQRAFVFIRTGR